MNSWVFFWGGGGLYGKIILFLIKLCIVLTGAIFSVL